MHNLRKYIRVVSTFLLINFLFSTFLPTVSYALTSGPTAPEATSFEPIDTTDMVNLQTGDFTYNIPLLEVPGPSGGYPLSLSYHAGIMPGEEASWVGLGWTLNPGAINRTVNGFADDHSNASGVDRQFWEGGISTNYNVGLSYGPGSATSFAAGMSISNDTYAGFGSNFYLTSNFNIAQSFSYAGRAYSGNTGIGAGWTVGGTLQSMPSQNNSIVGKFESGRGSTGFSLSSTNGNASFSFTNGNGASGVHNGKKGNISTDEGGYQLGIPIWTTGLWLNLSHKYRRYWIDEMVDVNMHGALHFPSELHSTEHYKTNAYDVFSIIDRNAPGGYIDNSDPNTGLGGTFPNYDDFSVNAQGVTGEMQPHLFRKHLVRQQKNKKQGGSESVLMNPVQTGFDGHRTQFRFKGEFSNQHQYAEPSFEVDGVSLNYVFYDENPESGELLKIGDPNDDFDNDVEDYVAGSKHIQYFTNKEINDNLKDSEWLTDNVYIETNSTGFDRSNLENVIEDKDASDQIGAFIITNTSGVKYHFSLPAYSYDEWSFTENTRTEGENFNSFKKSKKYAYTWYLTAVTGPDFVDRSEDGSPNGILDDYDWGYWVDFNYGLWADDYGWRNPVIGMNVDIEDDFKTFSRGKKELYYLNTIKTKSHVAVFEKSLRADAKGVTFEKSYAVKVEDESVSYLDQGGFDLYKNILWNYTKFPKATLKLSNVFLLKRSKFDEMEATGSFESFGDLEHSILEGASLRMIHHGKNVIDDSDGHADLVNNCIRQIKLTHDYSLCPETVNSFDENGLLYQESPSVSLVDQKSGKLSLKELAFLGHGGANSMPPMQFSYDSKEAKSGNGRIDGTVDVKLVQAASGLSEGDLVKLSSGTKIYYALVTRIDGNSSVLRNVGNEEIPDGIEVNWETTKNPPYNSELYDNWGMYKPDVDEGMLGKFEFLARDVSVLSSSHLDVWSLRSIKTVTGAEIDIEYESDQYNKPELYKETSIPVDAIEIAPAQIPLVAEVKIWMQDYGIDFDEFIPSIPYTEVHINAGFVLGFPKEMGVSGQGPAGYVTCTGPFGSTQGHKTFESSSYTFSDQSITSTGKENGLVYVTVKNSDLLNMLNVSLENEDMEIPIWTPDDCTGSMMRQYMGEVDVLGGYIQFDNRTSRLEDEVFVGGGIRTSSIRMSSLLENKATEFAYANGATSYEPMTLDKYKFKLPDNDYYQNSLRIPFDNSEITYDPVILVDTPLEIEAARAKFNTLSPNYLEEILDVASSIPPPGVMYADVSITEKVNGNDVSGEVDYSFNVFSKNMVNLLSDPIEDIDDLDVSGHPNLKRRITRKLNLQDNTGGIGGLRKIEIKDREGLLISSEENIYLNDGISTFASYKGLVNEKYFGQGIIEEVFAEAREVNEIEDGKTYLMGSINKIERLPSILVRKEIQNYKTGITTTTENLAFDFYSGAVTKTRSTDGYGNTFVSESVPAYRAKLSDDTRAYSGMGLAINGGKNMLTQTAANYTWKVDPEDGNNQALMAANIQTWNDEWKYRKAEGGWENAVASNDPHPVWRKHKSYSYTAGQSNLRTNDDGLVVYDPATFQDFDSWTASAEPEDHWQKNAEITLYDRYSHALEATDINGNFAATKMDNRQEKVLATVANASYDEFAYSGAEDWDGSTTLGGGVTWETGAILSKEENSYDTHTGDKVMGLVAGNKGFTFISSNLTPERKYRVSVWSDKEGLEFYTKYDENDPVIVSGKRIRQSGDWILHEAIIQFPTGANQAQIYCQATEQILLDDFRFHPIDAPMTTYVYNEYDELTFVLDNNNLYTEYQYDDMGRLERTYRESFKYGRNKVSEYSVHYARNSQE